MRGHVIRLRLPERILLHLFENSGQVDPERPREPPLPLTQAGIVESLNYSLERVSTGLRELISEGLVSKKRFYWRESGRFRNFYFPTQEGTIKAQELIDILRNQRVKIITPTGILKEMTLEDLRNYLKKLAKPSKHDVYELKEKKYVEITYTNILNQIKGNKFEVKSFVSPQGLELNERVWEMVRDAYYDSTHKYVVLTRNKHWQAGIIWLREGIKMPFIVEFKFKIGGGSGGDGLVLMFYKRKDYWPADGGNLGFVPGVGIMPGYGVEFDTQPNPDYNDPPYPHIALIKDSPTNHLAYVEHRQMGDFNWHRAKVSVGISSVKVEVDGKRVLQWEGEISRAHSGIGIAASTGGMTNWHIVDDIKITKKSLNEPGAKHQN
ncbi:MAG: hypothetical protein QXU01_01825 [Candidatus Hadarchaeales archaeon]